MKATFVYTENVGVRVESKLKNDLKDMSADGVDVPELVREALREVVIRYKRSKHAS